MKSPSLSSCILLAGVSGALCFAPDVGASSLQRSIAINLGEREGLIETETSLVWNQALGILHPPLEVTGIQQDIMDPAETRSFDLGSGSHGAFVPSRYQEFSDGGDLSGNIIRLNTADFPELLVTEFFLQEGWTLEPLGSEPLIIRSLSSIVVEGVIHCVGEPGQDQDASSPQQVALGGRGRCGGGQGGSGGTVDVGNVQVIAAEAGEVGGANVTGGGGAPDRGPTGGVGGGGGGAYSQALEDASDGIHPDLLPGVGERGASFQDDAFEVLGAGSGGGGGSGFGASSGAGGGGGGGLVKLFAAGDIRISPTGAVLVRGGNGGGLAGLSGGGGGGGGGGSALLFAGGRIWLDGPRLFPAEPYAVSAERGQGGVSSGGDGGRGALGRTWLTDSTGVPGGTESEEPISVLADPGRVAFATGTFLARLSGPSLHTSFPKDIRVRVYDSQSPAGLLTPPEVITQTDTLGGQLDLQLELLNSDPIAATVIGQIHVDYELFRLEEAEFISSCGHVDRASLEPASPQLLRVQQGILILLFVSPLILCGTLRFYVFTTSIPRQTGT